MPRLQSGSWRAAAGLSLIVLAGCPGPAPQDGGAADAGPGDAGPDGCLDAALQAAGAQTHRFEEVSLIGGDLITLDVVRVPDGETGPPWSLRAAAYQRGEANPVCVTAAADLTYQNSPTGSGDSLAARVGDGAWVRLTTEGQLDPFDDDGNALKLDHFPMQLEDASGAVTYGPVSATHTGPQFWPPVCPLDAVIPDVDGGVSLGCASAPSPEDEVIALEDSATGLAVTLARRPIGDFSFAYQPYAATRLEIVGCGIDLCREAAPPDTDTCVDIPCQVQTGELLYSVAYHNFTDWVRTVAGDVVLRLDTKLTAPSDGSWRYRLVGLDAASGQVVLGPVTLRERQ